MRNKNWKKVIALLAAVSVVTAGIPGIVQYATATGTEEEVSDNGTASEGEGADGEEKEEEEPQVVSENGEVVMKNAIEKKPESEWITMKDYEVITESDAYKMYFYEPTLSIMLENKETGKILESTLSDEKDDWNSNQSWNSYMKSGIVLTAIKNNKNGFQLDLVSSPHTLDVTKNDKGFSAKIFFSEYKVGLTMEVSLEGDNLVVNIPDDSIVEEQEGSYISTISPYPFMGYSFLDEKKGYMLIPDGNGALINLDNKEAVIRQVSTR